MKKFFISIISCLSGVLMFAQSDITALEYYIDVDPGVGLGTSVPVTQGQEIDLNFTVPISGMGLSSGVHFMVVRTQNLAGDWSMYERRVFYIQDVTAPPPPSPQDITALEYFIGVDPGVGLATSVAITPGQEIDITDLFDANSLGTGFHSVSVRAKNLDDRWGFTETRIFYVQGAVSNPPQTPEDITALEYFFDDDPGVGLGTSITITQGQALDFTDIINTSGLGDGFHTITVRAKNAVDRWGMGETRVVYVQNINPINPAVANITALEYFYDTDPGAGNGVQIPISPSANTVDTLSMLLETGDTLTIGPHTVTIRALNENGQWGHRETVTFNVDGNCPIAGLSVQNACEGEAVQLIDTSSGFVGAVDYRWYADGQLISTFEGDTAHVFETPGMHTLSLAIENGAVCTDSTGVQINIKPKPIVVFSAETVQFGTATDYEVDEFNVDGTYYWAWDFDTDGTIDDTTVGATSFTFASDGTFLTTLQITDSLGCGASYSKMVTVDPSVTPANATARFSSSSVCEGSPVSFIDLSTEIPPGSVYSWDFDNDGTEDNATAGDVQFSFASFGTYNTMLSIITPADDTLTYNQNVVVTQQPVADFSVGTACAGTLTTFTDLSTGGGSGSYSWDFDGDGVTDSTTVGSVSFMYTAAGNYAPSLRVDNGNGCVDFVALSIVVGESPQSDFDFTYSTSGNTATVEFENLSNEGISYAWDFGDGGTSPEENPSHDFINFDGQTFNVCLTVTNDCSQIQYCENLALTATGISNATARFTPSSVCEGNITSFLDLSTGIEAGSTYSWDFDNDGTVDDSTVGDTQFSYANPGTYSAMLTIVTPGGDTLTHVESVMVTPQPTADFMVGSACPGEVTTFTDISTADGSASYSWDFDGDGVTDSTTVGNTSFVYTSAGNYAPSLLVDNGNGCVDFKAVSIVVQDSPLADFDFTYSASGNTASVEFDNLSENGADYSWDFGDGGTSTETHPSYNFLNFDGQTFNVCLTVTNGCSQVQYCEQINFTITGIQDLSAAGIKLYPNPADQMIHLDGFVSKDEHSVEIYDLSGRLILNKATAGTSEIDISQVRTGTYILHLINLHTKERFAETIVINR